MLVDLNHDGYLDLVRNNAYGGLFIYLNRGPNENYQFGVGSNHAPNRELSASTFHDGQANTEGVFVADFDNDGWLDLIIENHDFGIDVFANPKDGTANFTCLDPAQLGLPSSATDGDYGTCVDFDDDGDVDIIARKRDENDFFVNNGDGTFSNGQDIGQSRNYNKGGVVFADFDNDGDYDLYWTDNDVNQIWLNDGSNTLVPTATATLDGEPWASAGIGAPNKGIDGCAVGDVNNDGKVDLFLTANSGASYLFINQTIDGNPLSFVRDNKNINVNGNGEGAAFADYDQDGDLDLYINLDGKRNQLWRNGLNDGNYLFVEPRINLGNGIHRAALGANVILRDCAGEVISGIREVPTTAGHGTDAPDAVHFGLPGGPDQLYTVEVRFVTVNGVRKIVQRSVVPAQLNGHKVVIYDTDPSLQGNCADFDQDGIGDAEDLDDDNDGIPDQLEQTCSGGTCVERDSDGDGTPDHKDLDSDNDGIADLVEAGGIDTNGDGQVDQLRPSQTFPVTLTVTDNDGCSATHTGTITVGSSGSASFDPAGTTGTNCTVGCPGYSFEENGGQLVLEAENYDLREQRRDAQNWIIDSGNSGFSGTGYVRVADGTTSNATYAEGARLTYQVAFNNTGTYHVFGRVIAADGAANSAHIAVDGQVSSSVYNGPTLPSWQWVSFGTVAVNQTGPQDIHLVKREDGILIDKLVFTQSSTPPSGAGPSETLCTGSGGSGSSFSWLEDFAMTDGSTTDNGSTAWSLTYNGGGSVGVKGSAFEFRNVQKDGGSEAVWRSETTNITGLNNVTVSLQGRSDGGLESNQDYLRLYYRLDGGSEVLIADLDANFNGNNPQTFSVNGLNGNTVQVVVRAFNTSGSEAYFIDDVQVAGSSSGGGSGSGSGGGQAPTAIITVGSQNGTDVTFSGASSSDPDGSIVSYSWDFGDGQTATGANPSHTYTLFELVDQDNDGLSDTYDNAGGSVTNGTPLPLPDSDGDGLPDVIDLDSDNDGMADLIEVGGLDRDGDGRVDDYRDADFDGLHDHYDGKDNVPEGNNDAAFAASANDPLVLTGPDDNHNGRVDGNESYLRGDTDQDGHLNLADLDSDQDGIADLVEAKGIDADGDGRVDSRNGDGTLTADVDGDGFADAYDADLNNDGDTQDPVDTGLPLITSQAISSSNGRPDSYPHRDHDQNPNTPAWSQDQDADERPDFLDLDDDGDGITTVVEAWGTGTDSDRDGRTDGDDNNGNGWADAFEDISTAIPDQSTTEFSSNTQPDVAAVGYTLDFDGDGLPNYLDLDADNDGIIDLIEAQPTTTFASPSQQDLDRNGLDDQYQQNVGQYLVPFNCDGDNSPDYLDLDADDDGEADSIEGHDTNGDGLVNGSDQSNAGQGTALGTDADLDGLDDGFDNVTGGTADATNGGQTPSGLPQADAGTDRDWRSTAGSTFPVEWLSFEAQWQDARGLLRWETAAEENNDFFAIERSRDGIRFEAIGKVPSQGNSSNTQRYDFTDVSAANFAQGLPIYYRLRQVDLDGQTDFSNRVELLPDGSDLFKLVVYPNPATEYFNLRYSIPQDGRVRILNQNGAVVFEQWLSQGKEQEIRLSLPNVTTGVYYVSLKAGELQQTQTLIMR